MPVTVTNALACAEAILTTTALTDAATTIIPDPGTASATRRVNITFCNTTGADITVDVARFVGGTNYSIASGWNVPKNDSRIMENVALTNGRSIRARASNAGIHVTADIANRTET